MGLISRFRNAWNVFKNRDPTWNMDTGPGYYLRPDRMRFKPEVVQFFDDNLSDYNRNWNGLAQDIAK